MTDKTLPPPPVMWAQRQDVVFLTINLEDVKDPQIKFEKSSLYFKGLGGVDKKEYEVTIPLHKDIDAEQSKSLNRERCIETVLVKAEPGWWSALTSDKKKHHWVKCDFNKWVDEDDSGDEQDQFGGGGGGMGGMGGGGAGGQDFQEMLRSMGNLRGASGDDDGGKPPNFYDLSDEEDSDDEPIPDLEN